MKATIHVFLAAILVFVPTAALACRIAPFPEQVDAHYRQLFERADAVIEVEVLDGREVDGLTRLFVVRSYKGAYRAGTTIAARYDNVVIIGCFRIGWPAPRGSRGTVLVTGAGDGLTFNGVLPENEAANFQRLGLLGPD